MMPFEYFGTDRNVVPRLRRLASISLRGLRRLFGDRQTKKLAAAVVQTKLRNFEASNLILTGIDDVAALEIRASNNMQCRNFEPVIRAYRKAISIGRSSSKLRRLYLEAIANLERVDLVRDFLCKEIDEFGDDVDYAAYLYRYAKSYDHEKAIIVSDRLLKHPEIEHLSFYDQLMLAHDFAQSGDLAQTARMQGLLHGHVVKSWQQSVAVEMLESQLNWHDHDYPAQLTAINKALYLTGLCPIAAKNSEEPISATNLAQGDGCASVNGPLISVLMTARNSSETIENAISSILQQTHTNLELLIVDDASADDTVRMIDHITNSDARTRLIRLDRNVGTYAAKNIALEQASGTFVTCQDSDDWAHPQKLERLAEVLTAQPHKIAAYSHHVRCSATGGLNNRNGYYTRRDVSSLMYRRSSVVGKIGYYDAVRAGADGEHQFRLERVFGQSAVIEVPLILNFVAQTETSLTGGGIFNIDDNTGVFSPLRNAYRRAYCSWHENAKSLHMPLNPEWRPFQVPRDLLP